MAGPTPARTAGAVHLLGLGWRSSTTIRVPGRSGPWATRRARGPHGRGQFGHDGQPEARALAGRARCPVGGEVPVEHPGELVGRDAGPVVVDPQDGTVVAAVPARPRPGGWRTRRRSPPGWPAIWPSRSLSARTRQGTSGPGSERRGSIPSSAARGWNPPTTWRTTSAASTVPEVEGEAVGVEPGQVEQVLDQPLEAAGLGADDGGGRLGVVGGAVEHGVGVAADRGERRAQLVGDRQQELAFLVPGPGQGRRPWR